MRKFLPLTLIIIAAIVIYLVVNRPQSNNNTPSTSDPITISAPNNTVKPGKTYIIKWIPGAGKTNIFLISRAFETEGISVSIADQVYGVENNGQYTYTFPKNIPAGEYKFQIGINNSEYFTVSK